MTVHIALGNVAALDAGRLMPPGRRITSAGFDPVLTSEEIFKTVTETQSGGGFWVAHSTQPPAWVESNDPGLAESISAHYGCPIGRPHDWE